MIVIQTSLSMPIAFLIAVLVIGMLWASIRMMNAISILMWFFVVLSLVMHIALGFSILYFWLFVLLDALALMIGQVVIVMTG